MSAKRAAVSDALRATLFDALLHPVRGPILAVLAEHRTATAREIGSETSLAVESVSHQLRRLRREGLVEIAERRPRRGVAENVYRATLEPILDDAEFGALTPAQRRMFVGDVIKRFSTDANRALKAETLDSRQDACLTHARMLLDERGWRELALIHREAFEKVSALREAAAARLKAASSAGIPAASTVLCFELPDLAVVPINPDG